LNDVITNSLRLQYSIELDIFACTDGPSQHPIQERLDYFKRLQKAWLELEFPRRDTVKLASPWSRCHFHQGAIISDLWRADNEANSSEYNRLIFASTIANTPYVESTSPLLHQDYYRCILDTAQDLFVLVRVPSVWPTYVPRLRRPLPTDRVLSKGELVVSLRFETFRSKQPHPFAQCPEVHTRVTKERMSYVLDLLEEHVALLCHEKLCIWNWRTGEFLAEVIQLLDDQITNISLIAPGYILVMRPAAGLGGLQLCSFPLVQPSRPSDHPLVTQVIYQSPSFRENSTLSDIRIHADRQTFLRTPNLSDPLKEAPLRPFHLSSQSRVFVLGLVLSESPHGTPRDADFVIFIISTTFMKYVNPSQPTGEPRIVLGEDWLYDTQIFTGVDTYWVEEVQISGSRVVFSTTDEQRDEVRIEIIDFNPEVAARVAGVSQKQWSGHSAVPINGANGTEITAMFGRRLILDHFADPVVCAMPYTVSVRTVKVDPDEVIFHDVCIDEERLAIIKVRSYSTPRSKTDLDTMTVPKHP
jgi:hypothetical protein